MGNRTTGEFLNGWLEQAVRGNVRQSTYMAYRGYIVNHLQGQIGGGALADLRAERLQSLIASLQAKGLAGKTVRSIMLMLRGALKAAVDYEYIARNPCDKARLPKLEEKEVSVFDTAGQRRLERAVAESGDTRNYGVLICLYTGLRIGELCGLRWGDINFGQRTVEIKNSLNLRRRDKKDRAYRNRAENKKVAPDDTVAAVPLPSPENAETVEQKRICYFHEKREGGRAAHDADSLREIIKVGGYRVRKFSRVAAHFRDAGDRNGRGRKDGQRDIRAREYDDNGQPLRAFAVRAKAAAYEQIKRAVQSKAATRAVPFTRGVTLVVKPDIDLTARGVLKIR
jgi:hypothetical protein